MPKRRFEFKITDAKALHEYCPSAVSFIPTPDYAIIAILLEAACLSGRHVPGVHLTSCVDKHLADNYGKHPESWPETHEL